MGCNLSLLQLFLLRELSALFYGTELMVVALLCSYFFGQALGFLAYRWLAKRFVSLSVLWAAIPLALLIPTRMGIGWLRGHDFELLAMLAAFGLLTTFGAVYSGLLPRVIDTSVRTPSTFAAAYSAELAGTLFGISLLVGLGSWRWLAVAFFYPAILCLLVARVSRSSVLRIAVLALTLISGLAFLRFDQPSAEQFYRLSTEAPENATLCFREDSALQKVDVLESGSERRLYLNGVEYFAPGALEHFNFYLSELPARALKSQKVLVIGSGSMSSAGRLSQTATEVTNVEIDPVVVKASKLYFSHLHPAPNFPWRIVYADARVFLRQTEERFDLVILDVPTSFNLQTGSLFTRDFFELVRSRLTPEGAMSIYLSERVSPGGRQTIAGPILSAFVRTFRDVSMVVAQDAHNSFAVGAMNRPDLKDKIDAVLSESGRFSQDLYDTQETRHEAGRWKPASLENLRHVWEHQ